MNRYVDAFLRGVLEEVKYKKIHPYLAQELNDHIELLKEDIMAEEGLDEEAAYKKAVGQMGDAKDVGIGFHKMHKPVLEWRVLLIMVALIGIGILTIAGYSAQFGQQTNMALKQVVLASVASVGVIYTLYKMKYTLLEKMSYVFYILGWMFLMLTHTVGITVNGATRWIAIGPIIFQGATVAVPLIILAFVGFIRKWGNQGLVGWMKLMVVSVLPGVFCSLNYFSKGIVLLLSCIFIMIVYTYTTEFKGSRKKVLRGMLALGIVEISGIVYGIVTVPYRLERVLSYMNPARDPFGNGYMPLAIRDSIKNARWIGSSINMEQLRVPYEFDGSTDLIFNYIIGSMGMLVAAGVVLMVVLLIVRCFKMGYKVREHYGKLVIYGFSAYFVLQFMMSITYSMGWLPVGISYMPFVSYGGSNLTVDMMIMGLIVCIYRYKDIVPYELLNKRLDTKSASGKHKMNVLKDMFAVIADEELDKTPEEIVDVLADQPTGIFEKLAMVILKHSNEVEEIKVKFKNK